MLQAFCSDARHEFCPDDVSLLDSGCVVQPELLTPPRLTDLYLLALARHHGAYLATFDKRVPVEAIEGGSSALVILET